MRLFVAIELPEELRGEIVILQGKLREQVRRGRFPAPEHLHLTVHFLGETPEQLVEDVGRALGEAAAASQPFRLAWGRQLRYFGPAKQARVVWLGCRGEVAALKQLQRRMAAALEPLGFAAEARPYEPHLTLAREAEFLLPGMLQPQGRLALAAGPLPKLTVERVALFASTFAQGKLVHRAIRFFPLQPIPPG